MRHQYGISLEPSVFEGIRAAAVKAGVSIGTIVEDCFRAYRGDFRPERQTALETRMDMVLAAMRQPDPHYPSVWLRDARRLGALVDLPAAATYDVLMALVEQGKVRHAKAPRTDRWNRALDSFFWLKENEKPGVFPKSLLKFMHGAMLKAKFIRNEKAGKKLKFLFAGFGVHPSTDVLTSAFVDGPQGEELFFGNFCRHFYGATPPDWLLGLVTPDVREMLTRSVTLPGNCEVSE